MTKHKPDPSDEMALLGAFLDGSLSEPDREALKLRLDSEPALYASLQELRQLRKVCRSLPVHKAPRHFTLTTLEAQQIWRKTRLIPFFGYGALSSFFMLSLLLISQLFMPFTAALPEQASKELAEASYAQDQALVLASETPEPEQPAAYSAPVSAQEVPVYVINWKGMSGLGESGTGSRGAGIGLYGRGGFSGDTMINTISYVEAPTAANLFLPSENILGPRPTLEPDDLAAIFDSSVEEEAEGIPLRVAGVSESEAELPEPAPAFTQLPDQEASITPAEPQLPALALPQAAPSPVPTLSSRMDSSISTPTIYGLRLDEAGMELERYPSSETEPAALAYTEAEEEAPALQTETYAETETSVATKEPFIVVAVIGLGALTVILGIVWLLLRKQ